MMTKNRFEKTAIRQRMAITGEVYSVAARALAASPLTTWPSLDEVLAGGFRLGALYDFTSRPGSGAAALRINLAVRLAMPHRTVAYINLEATPLEVTRGLFEATTGEQLSGLFPFEEQLKLQSPEAQRVNKLIKVSSGPHTVASIRAFLLTLPEVKVAVIDLLPLLELSAPMKGSSGQAPTYVEKHARIAKNLQELALELKIPIIVFSRLRRNGSELEPKTLLLLDNTELAYRAEAVIKLAFSSEGALVLRVVKNRSGVLSDVRLKLKRATCQLLEF